MSNIIYLDHNATTPIDARVLQRMQEASLQAIGNAASQHRLGRQARQLLDDAVDSITELLGGRANRADADRLIITSGGTEANNMALRGLSGPLGSRLIVSSLEHPSVLGVAENLRESGYQVDYLRALREGRVDLDHLRELLDQTPVPRLVSVMLANNETGMLQPVEEVVRMCAPRGIPVHTDAVQVAGKIPLSFRALGVSAMTVTAHKLHGPCGVGALLVRAGLQPRPLLFGGSQQLELRPGTEPMGLTVGFQMALQLAVREGDDRRLRMTACRDRLESRIVAELPEVVVHGDPAARLPHTSNLSFPGVDRQSLLIALDLAGICCSTGSACASGSSQPSHVLQAMGLPEDQVASALRFSVGATTTDAEIDIAADRIIAAVRRLLGISPLTGGHSR
jgi:cysteine desulfurase